MSDSESDAPSELYNNQSHSSSNESDQESDNLSQLNTIKSQIPFGTLIKATTEVREKKGWNVRKRVEKRTGRKMYVRVRWIYASLLCFMALCYSRFVFLLYLYLLSYTLPLPYPLPYSHSTLYPTLYPTHTPPSPPN